MGICMNPEYSSRKKKYAWFANLSSISLMNGRGK
jgi:hypothetical protein